MFDRIEFERDLKEMTDPRLIFQRAEALSEQRLNGKLTKHEYAECMELIRNRLRDIESIKRAIK